MKNLGTKQSIFITFVMLALLFGLFFLARDSRPSKAYDYQECASYAQVQKHGFRVTPFTGHSEPKIAQDGSEEKQNGAEFDKLIACKDLAAQWAMADVTWYAYFAGLAGIFLVIFSIWATQDGNDIQSETARRGLRAYLNKSHDEILVEGDKYELCIKFKNGGETPASDIRVISQWFSMIKPRAIDKGEIENILSDKIVEEERVVTVNKISVPSGEECEIEVIFPDYFLENTSSGQRDLKTHSTNLCTVLLRIYYTDIYDVRRVKRVGLYSKNMHNFIEYENSEREVS